MDIKLYTFSDTMQFVIKEARRASGSQKIEDISSVHLLTGLIALSSTTADNKYFSDSDKPEVESDINRVKNFFIKYGIESSAALPYLKELSSQISQEEVREGINAPYLAMYANNFKLNEPMPITAFKMLKAIRDCEALLIKDMSVMGKNVNIIVAGSDEMTGKQKSDAKKHGTPATDTQNDGADELRELSELRHHLLSTVRGQDHVINQFVEALENASVLEDRDRKRPKAVFVFAGPPGVGKTMIAQESAKKLKIDFRQYNMTDYTDHQQAGDLIGRSRSWQGASSGALTEFVKKNPKCILLFDEIEKTHINIINLFHQLLDEGKMEDMYHKKEVDFRNTIVIFTTNAGKSLYENTVNCAGLSRKSIINSLETEKIPHPNSPDGEGIPIFPASICSRMASGYPIMFNHLSARILVEITNNVLRKNKTLFEGQYIDERNGNKDGKSSGVFIDPRIGSLILFSEGGSADARILSTLSENFFRKQITMLMKNKKHNEIRKLMLNRELSFLTLKVNEECEASELLKNPEPSRILYCGSSANLKLLKDELKNDENDRNVFEIYGATIEDAGDDKNERGENLYEAAAKIFRDNDIMFVLIDTAALEMVDVKKVFNNIREYMPDISVYLVEKEELDEDVYNDFTYMGLAGKVSMQNLPTFVDDLNDISENAYLKQQANLLARKNEVISFEATSIEFDEDNKSVIIRYGNFIPTRAVHAEDAASMLSSHEKPTDRFDDIIGIKNAKRTFDDCVEFLKDPKAYVNKGKDPPRGVLLYGPPGTGKTMLARALAGETDTAYFNVNASEFQTVWRGSGPKNIRELFQRARRYAPSIIFIDEIDTIGKTRTPDIGGWSAGSDGTLTTLFTELDGFTVNSRRPVIVIAATNFEIEKGKGGIGVLDPALVRRFDERIRVDLPDGDDRKKFLEIMLGKCKNYDKDTEGVAGAIETITKLSVGDSLSNLRNLITFVKKRANGRPITAKILSDAYDEYTYGEEKKTDDKSRLQIARHEAGHAFIHYKAGKIPAFLTIVSRSDHGGYMMPDVDEEKIVTTKNDLLDGIRTSLGGRAAELVCYGDEKGLSTGAAGDLASATNVAYRMIGIYGMDDTFGLISHKSEKLLDAVAPEIASRVKTVLDEELDKAKKLISDNKVKFDKLVDTLMDKERLVREEIEKILE